MTDPKTTTAPTSEEIAELIEFVRSEKDWCEDASLGQALSALAIAERLPALVAEVARLKEELRIARAAAEDYDHDCIDMRYQRDAALRDSAAFKKLFEENPSASWSRLNKAEAESARLRQQLAAAREALVPFANESMPAGPEHSFVCIPVEACDAARAALAQIDAPAEKEAARDPIAAAVAEEREACAKIAEAVECSDCPPVGYPTDKTRCAHCPRAARAFVDAHGKGEG